MIGITNKDKLVTSSYRFQKIYKLFISLSIRFFIKISICTSNVLFPKFIEYVKTMFVSKANYTIKEYLNNRYMKLNCMHDTSSIVFDKYGNIYI